MKVIEVNSLGFSMKYGVASDAEEYDRLAKCEGACVKSANSNTLYRSILSWFRSSFCEALEAQTGFERQTKATGPRSQSENEDDEPNLGWGETETEYVHRVFVQLVKDGRFESLEAAHLSFATLAQSLIDKIPFDPSGDERVPTGPKKFAKVYRNVARRIIAAGQAERVARDLSFKLGFTVDATIEGLSHGISEDQRQKRATLSRAGPHGFTEQYQPNEYIAVQEFDTDVQNALKSLKDVLGTLNLIPETSFGGQATVQFHLNIQPTRQLSEKESLALRSKIESALGVEFRRDGPTSPFARTTLIFSSGSGCVQMCLRDGLPTQHNGCIR